MSQSFLLSKGQNLVYCTNTLQTNKK